MRGGNWLPISKAFVRELPTDRPYTRLEAVFSLSLDYDQGNAATVKGYAELWQWSRGRVDRFIREVGASIHYPDDTAQKQNQRGQIVLQATSRSKTEIRQIRLIDSKWLADEPNRKQADHGQTMSRSQSTTMNHEPDPNPVEVSSLSTNFAVFWNAYPQRSSGKGNKTNAFKIWQRINPNDMLVSRILAAIEWQRQLPDWQQEGGRFIPLATTWLNGRRWEDELPQTAISTNKLKQTSQQSRSMQAVKRFVSNNR